MVVKLKDKIKIHGKWHLPPEHVDLPKSMAESLKAKGIVEFLKDKKTTKTPGKIKLGKEKEISDA